jgi:SAM-dependent methyltransferase
MQYALPKSSVDAPSESIATRPNPTCYLCGTRGERLYSNIPDRLFGTPGDWNFNRCPASECGLIWLDPIPTEDDIGKAYATYYTHDDAQPAWSGRLRKWWRVAKSSYMAQRFGCRSEVSLPLRLMAAAPIYLNRSLRDGIDLPLKYFAERKGRLLEIGCGAGDTLKLAADMGWDVRGLDIDPKAVANARGKGRDVHLGQLADQRLADESFDLVLMSHVIEHLHDPSGLLRESRRLLRRDGLLVVLTPNADSWSHARFGVHWRGLEPPRHLFLFNPQTLERTVRASGFGAISVSTTLRITPFVLAMSRMLAESPAAVRSLSSAQRLRGYAGAYAETMIAKFKPLAGSELLLEARK